MKSKNFNTCMGFTGKNCVKNNLLICKSIMLCSICILTSICIPAFNVEAQTRYYSLNGATNLAALNSWTQDSTGTTLLLPPINFSGAADIFVVRGNMSLAGTWNVAGTVLVNGSVSGYGYNIKRFEIQSGLSYFFGPYGMTADTLIIGSHGSINSDGFTVNKYLSVFGKLNIVSGPIVGTANFSLQDKGTLEIVNNSLNKAPSSGALTLSGSRFLSKKGNFDFEFNNGTFSTGDGVPDTVNNLIVNLGGGTTGNITKSVTVTGDLICGGFSGSSGTNMNVVLTADTLSCFGSISMSNGNVFGAGAGSSIVLLSGTASGNDTLSTLPPMTIPNLVVNCSKRVQLSGDVIITKALNLRNGIIYTGANKVQVGVSSEGTIQRTNGYVVGNLARLKAMSDTSDFLFPLGTSRYYRPITISYTTPPSHAGVITVSHTDGNALVSLFPTINDAGFSLEKISTMYWNVSTLLLSGGVYGITLLPTDDNIILSHPDLHVVTSDIMGSNFSVNGSHYFDTLGVAKRIEIATPLGKQRFYVAGADVKTAGSVVFPVGNISFGDMPKDSLKLKTVSLGNASDTAVIFNSMKTSLNTFTLDSTHSTISPHKNLDIAIKFKPTDFGAFIDTLSLASGNTIINIPLLGSSSYPTIQISPLALDFGNVFVSDSAQRTITITNASLNTLIISSISNNNSVFHQTFQNATVSNNDTLKLTILFKPVFQTDYKDTLYLTNNSHTPLIKMALLGNGVLTAIARDKSDIPKSFEVSQNYPNPFNPSTIINYQLPVNSSVTLKIYDLLGRGIATLIDGKQDAGYYNTTFNGPNLPSGVYIYRLQAGSFSNTKKLLLLK